MPKPRVALIFSGQPRCVDGISYQSFQKCILDRYDVDVYAHFWEDVESSKTTGTASANIELFKQLYSPKAIRTDPSLKGGEYPLEFIQRATPHAISRHNVLTTTDYSACILRNCVSMYESMYRAYELCKASGETYDWILRARTDAVLLRCPALDALNPKYLYSPQWHSLNDANMVNIVLIVPQSLAENAFSIRKTIESLSGVSDEWFIFNHLARCGLVQSIRTLPKSIFYPTLTRDGRQTDRPEPTMTPEVVVPPYSMYAWIHRWTPTDS